MKSFRVALALVVYEVTAATTAGPSQESHASVVLPSERYRVEPVQVDRASPITTLFR